MGDREAAAHSTGCVEGQKMHVLALPGGRPAVEFSPLLSTRSAGALAFSC